MAFIAVFAIIFLISLFFKVYLGFKTEEAMFTSMGAIIIVLTLSGMAGIMNYGQYLVYALTVASAVFIVVRLVKLKLKYDFTEIITPGVMLTFLSFIIYMIITKNNVMYIWDEASCYGTAAHYMHVTDRISNGGSVTVLSYFFTEFAGYSEHALFVSKWLFIWICLALPLSYIKWDKWYLAAIYGALSFGIATLIDPEPHYLMDAAVGVAAGAGIAYLAVARHHARTTVLILSCLFTITAKDNIGLILFSFMVVFFAAYFIIEQHKKHWRLSKKELLDIGIFIASSIVILVIKNIVMPVGLPAAVRMFKQYLPYIIAAAALLVGFIALWYLKLHKLAESLSSRIRKSRAAGQGIAIALALIIPLALFAVFYKGTWQILYSLDANLQQDFIYSLNAYFGRGYFGIPLWSLGLILLISAVICGITIIKKEHKASFIAQAVAIVLIIIVYAFVIGMLYVKVYNKYLHDGMMGLERYVGSLVIMICIWLMGIVFVANDYWEGDRKQYLAAVAVGVLLVKCMPLPGETMFASVTNPNMISYKNIYRPMLREHAKIINEYTPNDAKILVICMYNDNDSQLAAIGGFAQMWLYYEIVPRPLPVLISPMLLADKPEHISLTVDELWEFASHYDYIYIGNADEEFYEDYGTLFDSYISYKTKALYKNNRNNDNPQFELVYADEIN